MGTGPSVILCGYHLGSVIQIRVAVGISDFGFRISDPLRHAELSRGKVTEGGRAGQVTD